MPVVAAVAAMSTGTISGRNRIGMSRSRDLVFMEIVASNVPRAQMPTSASSTTARNRGRSPGVAMLHEEQRKDRHRDRLDDEQEDEVGGGLGEEDGYAINRAQQQPVEALLVLLLGERTVQTQ